MAMDNVESRERYLYDILRYAGILCGAPTSDIRAMRALLKCEVDSDPAFGVTIHTPSRASKFHKILGENFHGADSWHALGLKRQIDEGDPIVRFSEQILDVPFPFNPEMKVSEACIMVFIPGAESLNSFHALVNHRCRMSGKEPAFHLNLWRQGESFARKVSGQDRWMLILKDPPGDTVSLNFRDSMRRVPPASKLSIIGARELVIALGLHWFNSDERLYAKQARTSDFAWCGHRVMVGSYDEAGLWIGVSEDSVVSESLGLALGWDCTV